MRKGWTGGSLHIHSPIAWQNWRSPESLDKFPSCFQLDCEFPEDRNVVCLIQCFLSVSRTILGTWLVLNQYSFKEGRERRKDHGAPWPALSQMRELCIGEVDRWQEAAISVFSNW